MLSHFHDAWSTVAEPAQMTKSEALRFGPFMFLAGLFSVFVGWRKLDPPGPALELDYNRFDLHRRRSRDIRFRRTGALTARAGAELLARKRWLVRHVIFRPRAERPRSAGRAPRRWPDLDPGSRAGKSWRPGCWSGRSGPSAHSGSLTLRHLSPAETPLGGSSAPNPGVHANGRGKTIMVEGWRRPAPGI